MSRLILGLILGMLSCAGREAGDVAKPQPGPPVLDGSVQIRTGECSVLGTSAAWRHAGPEAQGAGALTLVLLHGARFSSETWEELGTLEYFAQRGQRVIALDLPGRGGSATSQKTPGEWLGAWFAEENLSSAVVVAPSMSGCFLFPFLASQPERVAGIVVVAPSCAPQSSGELPGTGQTPALVLWGARDQIQSPARAAPLARILGGAELVILPEASHPCYLDEPIRFHELVWDFIRGCQER